jgi:hypothetical protein
VLDDLGDTAMLRGSGFLARILYSMPASLAGNRRARPTPVPEAVASAYHRRLHTMAHELAGWTADPALLRFSTAADDLMAELQDDLEEKLNPRGGAMAHIGDWVGKLHGQTARIAALLHVAEHPHNPWEHAVTGETFTQAWRLADYYAGHALVAFDQIGADPALDNAHALLDWIKRTQPASFTKRDAHASNRARFQRAAHLDPPLELLEEHGHIARQNPPEKPAGAKGRPPSPTYWTHPAYREEQP